MAGGNNGPITDDEIVLDMRSLRLPGRVATTMERAEGREVFIERPTPGIEVVDQREEVVRVHNGKVPYLVSRPIPEGKILRKVIITIISKDQGHSKWKEYQGTYYESWTWFELSVGQPSRDSEEKWRGQVVKNLHAHGEFKEHTIEMSDKGLYEKAKSGDVLTVWAHARFPSWVNTVKKVTIRCVVE